jgi:hypothetical protein
VSLLASQDGGALIRVIAGEVGGGNGPGMTHTPMAMTHITVSPGARVVLPWSRDHNALVYALAGNGSVGAESRPISSGQLAVFGAGDALTITADEAQESRTPALDVLVLGGRPIREEVAWYGPFVMNTQDELRQAFDDFRAGRMGAVPATHAG